MSNYDVTLAVAGGWLLLLSVVVLLLVRQLGLVTLRLDMSTQAVSLNADGPEIGTRLPDRAVSLLYEVQSGLNYVLLLSANCDPCRQIAPSLSSVQTEGGLIAVIPGPEDLTEALASLLPANYRTIRDPAATQIAEVLGITRTPSVFEIEDGILTGKAWIFSHNDFQRLVDAREHSNAANLVHVPRDGASVRAYS